MSMATPSIQPIQRAAHPAQHVAHVVALPAGGHRLTSAVHQRLGRTAM